MSRNSSISSFDASWHSFLRTLLLAAVSLVTLIYLLVLIIDPYDSVSFSPDWQRFPVSRSSRHFNAVLARESRFDSAVVGTSTSMLLRPAELDRVFGGAFANLAMPAASAYEQQRLLEVFRRRHTRVATLLLGLDAVWCMPDGAPKFVPGRAKNPFPEWLFDDNPWNDLPPLTVKTLQHAHIQLRALLGLKIKHPLRPDGYQDISKFLYKQNDAEHIRERIYAGEKLRLSRTQADSNPALYPDLDQLAEILAGYPTQTLKVLFFSPSHYFHQPEPESDQEVYWHGCKAKAARIGERLPNTVVLDFMIRSRITTADEHFLDGYHYTKPIAAELVQLLYQGARERVQDSPEFRVLARSDGGF